MGGREEEEDKGEERRKCTEIRGKKGGWGEEKDLSKRQRRSRKRNAWIGWVKFRGGGHFHICPHWYLPFERPPFSVPNFRSRAYHFHK